MTIPPRASGLPAISLALCVAAFVQAAAAATVTVRGRHILVDGQRYIIKGVCYAPSEKCNPHSFARVDEDIALMKQAGVNTIRTYWPIADVEVLDAFAAAGIKIIMGFDYTRHMLDLDSPGMKYPTYIDTYKDHPAILMWEFGNEYNYHENDWFGGSLASNWYPALEAAAVAVHELDPNHPVSTAHGELPGAVGGPALELAPSVDVWGMNVYRWDVSAGVCAEFAAISDKPMYIAEAGADSYNTSTNNAYDFGPDEQMQSDATRALLKGILSDLSVGSGVTMFQFIDGWAKAGSPCTHDSGGVAPNSGGVPYDGAANEEYWGILNQDRTPKLSFSDVREFYAKMGNAPEATAGSDRTASLSDSSASLDGRGSSDPGDLPITYRWTQMSGPTAASLAGADTATPVVSGLAEGTYVFELTVDNGALSSSDRVRLAVSP